MLPQQRLSDHPARVAAVCVTPCRHKAGEEALGALPQRWVSIVFARAGQFYQIYLRMLDEGVAGA